MSFRFIHTADWQIGKPFRNFEPRLAGILEDERIEVIDRIAAMARAHSAAHVLVAGDVFDGEQLAPGTLRRPLERMAAHAGLAWHLIGGNHDPMRAGGFWERLMARGLPANVKPHVKPEPVALEPGVVLLPAPLRTRAPSEDPTSWMDAAATAEGVLRIGLAHGSVKEFGEQGESAAVIDPARARSAGLAFLALGDWHGKLRVSDRVWYSGTPEPDRFADNEPGFALLVEVSSGAPARVTPLPTGRFVWASVRRDIARLEDVLALDEVIARLAPSADRLLLDVTLRGRLSVESHAAAMAHLDQLEARVRHLGRRLDGLRITTGADDLALLGESGELRAAAERLRAIAEDEAHPRRQSAETALARLFTLVHEVRGDAVPRGGAA